MQPHFQLKHTILVVALAAIYPVQASAAVSAGVAQFIAGDVNVRRADGKTDPLVKGKDVESGQSIVTGTTGRAQVKFTDGGLISLQPNTEFKIANYVDKADPGQDRFLVDLLRGSMRAITGLIGKRNHDNYKVTTSTATIGIRGSAFTVGYNPDGSLGVTTELDGIEVCNAGSCVGLTAGESVRVVNATGAPVRTNVRAPVPTPGIDQDPMNVGNQTNADGKAKIVTVTAVDKGGPVTPVTPANTGTYSNLKSVASYYSLGLTGFPTTVAPAAVATSATLDSGKLTAFTTAGKDFAASTYDNFSSSGTVDAGDYIGWGTWATGSRNPGNLAINALSYVVGVPTPLMPTTGSASYTALGYTPVSAYNTSLQAASAAGTLSLASLGINFATSKITNFSVSTSLGGFTVTSGISVTGGQFSYTNGSPLIQVDGFFAGVNASRAGVVYTGESGSIRYSGAIAFKTP